VSMSVQQTLSGKALIGSYSCGHGRGHEIPSESVTIYRQGGAGFMAGCECGDGPVDPDSSSLFLGDHLVLIGGKNLDDRVWLALDERAEWLDESDADREPTGGGETPRERRDERRAKLNSRVDE
jgi:hypothetical protein